MTGNTEATRMRIMHVMKVKGIGGAENHLLTLLPELQRGARVCLIVLVEPDKPMNEFVSNLRAAGVEVIRIAINSHLDFSMVWKIYHLVRRVRPHVFHTHLLHADIYGIPAAVLGGTEIVISTKHGYDEYDNTSLFYRLNATTSRWVNKVITISHALQAKVASAEGISRSKMVTIYYGLDTERYSSQGDASLVKTMLGVGDGVCVLGTVGRLIPVKGYESLLEALASVRLDFRLLIVGDGPLMGRLTELSRELGLEEKVKMVGFRTDVSRILSGIDVFVLPTLGEGFGLVLLEAMAHKIPIVSTNAMAVPEVVEHGKTGILVPPRDIKALREAIEFLIGSREIRATMGQRGFERLISTFSVEQMVRQTRELYAGLMREVQGRNGKKGP